MPRPPERGEVWLADLGAAAKVRPVLVVSVPFGETDYALLQVVPHTTQTRDSRFSVPLPTRFLEPGAFNVQGMLALPPVRFQRLLGRLTPDQMQQVEAALREWLALR